MMSFHMNCATRFVAATPRRRAVLDATCFKAIGAIALATYATWDVAHAQTADGFVAEEIIVTAQRREQSIQEVPVSVSAIGGEALESQAVQGLSDIAAQVPGLAVSSAGPGQTRIAIRGLSGSGSNFTTQSTIGYYLDDAPITLANVSFAAQFDPDFFDLQRLEVLRGPQGTLYGAGALGGAIKLVTHQPNLSRFESKARVSVASVKDGDMNYGAEGVVNLPIVDDQLALRVVGSYKRFGGYIDHAFPDGAVKKDVNASDVVATRVMLKYAPTDRLTITPSFLYQRTDADASNTYDLLFGDRARIGYYTDPSQDTLTLASLNIGYRFAGATLSSNTSYYDRQYFRRMDQSEFLTGTVRPIFNSLQPGSSPADIESEVLSQELRLSSDGSGPWTWTVGLFISRNDNQQIQAQYLQGITAASGGVIRGMPVLDDRLGRGVTENSVDQEAIFGEVSYAFAGGFEAAIGARYYELDTRFQRDLTGLTYGGTQLVDVPAKADGVIPKYRVSYTFDDDKMAFVSASKGFRLGGPNTVPPTNLCAGDLAVLGLSAVPGQFDADEAWSYELGAKTDWLGGRLRLNSSLYRIDWEDIQQSTALPCGFTFISNASQARSEGVEIETAWQVTQSFAVGGTLSRNKAEFTGDAPFVADGKGERILESPEKTASGYVQYTQALQSGWTLVANGTYAYYGDVRQNLSRTAARQYRPSYETVNLRIGVQTEVWEFSLFANNLLDEKGLLTLDSLNRPTYYIPTLTATTIAPRTVGAAITARF